MKNETIKCLISYNFKKDNDNLIKVYDKEDKNIWFIRFNFRGFLVCPGEHCYTAPCKKKCLCLKPLQ